MYKLDLISLAAESDNTYIVRCKSDGKEVEYRFTADDEPFLAIGCEISYAKQTNGDPAVPLLAQAIANFHQARHFQYEPENG